MVNSTAVRYYTSEARTCATRQVELGTPDRGGFHDDLVAGRLPEYSFVSPNACHDMQGAPACPTAHVAAGDRWLRTWVPRVLGGGDYRAGRLTVIITWDEGSATDNHIPTLVLSPKVHAVVTHSAYDHCSTLRTTEDLLHLAPLGCARSATPMISDFHLQP